MYAEFKQRYSILAAAAIPAGFCEAKTATTAIIKALGLTDDEHKMGNTKVFFRCGILGRLEDMRDERISAILTGFQALARGWLARKIYKKLMEQRVGVVVLQRNIRQHFVLRNWPWWSLYTKVKPLLSIARGEEELKEKEEQMKKAMEDAAQLVEDNAKMAEKMTKLEEERAAIATELDKERQAAIDAENLCFVLETKQRELEEENNELIDRIEEEEDNNFAVGETKREVERNLKEALDKIAEAENKIKAVSKNVHFQTI